MKLKNEVIEEATIKSQELLKELTNKIANDDLKEAVKLAQEVFKDETKNKK